MGQVGTQDSVSKILCAARHGEERAQKVQDRYGTDDPWILSSQFDVTIEVDSWEGLPSMSLLGTYASGTITLYEYQIEAFADTEERSTSEVYKIVCAHELAHHLIDPTDFGEVEESSLWSRVISRLFNESSKIGIRELEEVAAHAFAVTLTGITIQNVNQQLGNPDII